MGLLFLQGKMRDQGGPPQTPSDPPALQGSSQEGHSSLTSQELLGESAEFSFGDLIKMGKKGRTYIHQTLVDHTPA